MNQDDRVEQALDDFWKCMEQWRNSYMKEGHDTFMIECVNLKRAYDAWLDANKPPGDPHKEWVDASKLKPNDVFQPVLVKTTSGKTGLADWLPGREAWRVQRFMREWNLTKEGVTHWRYIPEMED